jgi:hypothetical protein
MLDVNVVIDNKVFNDIKAFFRSIKRENVISNYFKSDVRDDHPIDFFFYQLGLRKNLPIMDWLYLEYIKFLHKKSPITKLIIFPTIDMTAASQLECDFNEFRENIDKVFKNSGIKIDIIDPYKDIYFDKEDLISNDFIATLKFIGSKKYFDFLWEIFNIKITSISDFNKFHPVNDKIMNIYTHVNKSWCIINYIKKNVDLTKRVNISAIFWEWEVDKLGVIKHYSDNVDNITFCPVLGITQMLNKTTPIPIFIEGEAIGVFDNEKNIINKAIKFMPFLKKCNLPLESIFPRNCKANKKEIKDDGKKLWKNSRKPQNTQEIEHIAPTKDFYLFLGLIAKIRSLYKNENT